MSFWQTIKKDLEKEIKAGLAFFREGTAVMKKKAKEVSSEGKRHIRMIELKRKVHELMAGLGGRVYDLSVTAKDPMKDKKVLSLLARIRRLETQISKLEKDKKKPSKTAKTQKVTKAKTRIKGKTQRPAQAKTKKKTGK